MLIYFKTHRRHPVWLGCGQPFSDLQAQPPRHWCCRCGKELYAATQAFCPECSEEKGEAL